MGIPNKKQRDLGKKDRISALNNEAVSGSQAVHAVAFWGLAALLFLSPFFRGLFFPEDQQVALFFTILIFWLVWLWKWGKGDSKFLSQPLDYLVLAFPLVYLVSAFNAANTGLAVNEIVKTLLYFLVYWSVANLVRGEKDTTTLFKVICLAGVLVSLAGLATATGLIYIKDGFMGGRIFSTLQYPNALASYLMVAIIMTLYLWLHDEEYSLADVESFDKKKVPGFNFLYLHQYIYAISLYITAVVFIGAKSYGGVIVLALALIVYFIGLPSGNRLTAAFHLLKAGGPAIPCSFAFLKNVLADKHTYAWLWVLFGALSVLVLQWIYYRLAGSGFLEFIIRKRIIVWVFLVLIIFSLILAGSSYLNTNGQTSAGLLKMLHKNTGDIRLYFFGDAIKMISDKPAFGWGGGGWQEAYRIYQGYLYNSNQVHGHYLQIAVETGITGLILVLSIWVAFIISTYRQIKNARQNSRKLILWTVFTVAIAMGAHAVIDFDLSLSALALVLWSMWGLTTGLHKGITVQTESSAMKAVKRPTRVFVVASVFSIVLVLVAGCLITASSSAKSASMRLKAGDINQSVILMEKAAYYNPFNPDFNSNLSSLYARQGKLEPAIKQAQEALDKSKFSAFRHSYLAGLYISANRYEEAVAMAEKATELAPFQIEWYDFLARTYFTIGYNLTVKGKNSEANVIFSKATKIDDRISKQVEKIGDREKRLLVDSSLLAPSSFTRLYSGASLCMLGQFDKAETLLNTVLQLPAEEKNKAETYLWLGYIYQHKGQQAKSNELMARAKAIVPDAEKQYNYIYSMMNNGQYKRD